MKNTENATDTETKASLKDARSSTECSARGNYQHSLEILEETILLTLYLASPATIYWHYFARMRILDERRYKLHYGTVNGFIKVTPVSGMGAGS